MRVTAEKKQQTRRRIEEAARKLFNEKGFEQTTTRDIAESAGIATGTLFNYFPTKEALAMTIVAEALEQAETDFDGQLRVGETLDESLFAHVAAGLRNLAPHRHFVGDVLDTAWSPFAKSPVCEQAEEVRANHLETVHRLIAADDLAAASVSSFMTAHLYWTLYLSVLGFWANDKSPNQEDTLVVLDQSMRLFVASLSSDSPSGRKVNDVGNVTEDS